MGKEKLKRILIAIIIIMSVCIGAVLHIWNEEYFQLNIFIWISVGIISILLINIIKLLLSED
jgi:hypothetical protein